MREEPTRTEFMFLPAWQVTAFYILSAIAIAILFYQIYQRVRLWQKGKPIGWKPDYFGGIWRYVLKQRKVRTSRPKSGAPMHLLIFYGFLTLFIGTTLLAVNTYSPYKFHRGIYYLSYEFILDIMGLALIIGVVWAWVRRGLFKPKTVTSAPQDHWTLAFLLVLCVDGFITEAARMRINPKPFDTSAPIGHWLAGYMPEITPATYVWIWWVHSILALVFIAIIPQLRLRHILYGTFAAAGDNPEKRMGRLPTLTIEEVEKTGKIGAQHAPDYSRWHLMSLDACMECGRCTEVCPAWLVGKVLNPKRVAQDIRAAMADGREVAEAVSEEALWQCTTCNACVEACPVLIRHVDLIVDARRNLVAEGKLRGTAATMLRQVQGTRSAWGQAVSDREAWMQGLEIPLVRDLVSRGEKFDVLLWVGCAGAVDKGATKSMRDFAAMLKKAGVSFACLGKEEVCTGDPARRVGDEFLFQEMAQQNVATFAQYGVKTIVTACPHCFNTIKNEYPVFGGNYEVVHHTQMLSRLIEEGRLNAPNFEEGSVTLHDPCYLGRVNNISDAPRAALGVNVEYDEHHTPVDRWLSQPMNGGNRIAETKNHGHKTLCCGAGGGRMWMEEEPDQRPSDNRMRELLSTGAKTVAVACPFCRIMLDASGNRGNVELVDIVEIVERANR